MAKTTSLTPSGNHGVDELLSIKPVLPMLTVLLLFARLLHPVDARTQSL